jgi:hypothetical protein
VPIPASAGRLGMPFNVDTPKKVSKNFGSFVVVINHCIAIPFAFYDYER